MVKARDCGIIVRDFELQSRYYVHFRTKTLWKGMNPLILPAMGWIVVIYEALCFDVAQGQMNGAPNETRTPSCRFASLVC